MNRGGLYPFPVPLALLTQVSIPPKDSRPLTPPFWCMVIKWFHKKFPFAPPAPTPANRCGALPPCVPKKGPIRPFPNGGRTTSKALVKQALFLRRSRAAPNPCGASPPAVRRECAVLRLLSHDKGPRLMGHGPFAGEITMKKSRKGKEAVLLPVFLSL